MLHSSGETMRNLSQRLPLILALLVVWLAALLDNRDVVMADSNIPTAETEVYLPLVLRTCAPVGLIQDSSFEAGLPNPVWQTSSNISSDILDDTADPPPHSGSWKAWLGGDDWVRESLWQTITVPADATALQVSYWWRVSTLELNHYFDIMLVQIRNATGSPLETLETLTDGDAASVWDQSTFTITTYAGQTIQLAFVVETDEDNPTSFFVDDISVLKVCP